MNRVCLAYIAAGVSIDDKLKCIDFRKLTHIAVAFIKLRESNGEWQPYLSSVLKSNIEKIKAQIKEQHADTKILISVGGAEADGFCQISRTEKSRKAFAKSIVNIIDELNIDGVDMDWEYPGESALGIACCKSCKTDFVLLLEELRCQLASHLLTIAVGSNRYYGLDVKRINRIVDYVFVMTYDLGLMHSNLYLSKIFVMMWHICGISGDKLCIGVPLYGRDIKNLDNSLGFADLTKGRITHFFGQSFSDYKGRKWCFDTKDDIIKKACWADKRKLGGIFCWEITSDIDNCILNAMSKDKSY